MKDEEKEVKEDIEEDTVQEEVIRTDLKYFTVVLHAATGSTVSSPTSDIN